MWPRRLVVCLGLLWGPAALASPTIAFLNTAGHDAPAGHALAAARQKLAAHGFAAVGPGPIRDALEGPLARTDEDPPLARATAALATARARYADFAYDDAFAALVTVDKILTVQIPSEPVRGLWVEREVLAGLVHAGQAHEAQARADFALARQLDPTLTLDPARYQPHVLELFDQASQPARTAKLAIETDPAGAALWIDGHAAGTSPLTTSLGEGSHWVVAQATGRGPAGALVKVSSGVDNLSLLDLEALPPAARIAALRAPLLTGHASDDDQRAAAEELCGLVGAQVLFIVSAADGALVARAFDARSRALSEPVLLGSDDLLAALSEPAGAELALPAHRRDDARPWYRTGWGAGALIGAGALVAGTLLYVALQPGDAPTGVTIGGWCFQGSCP